MLTLSETAATVLAQSRSEQGMPDDALLRVAAAPSSDGQPGDGQQGISLGFVDEAVATDQTGESHGVPICVASEVSAALDAAQIDVQPTDDGAQLVIVPAPA